MVHTRVACGHLSQLAAPVYKLNEHGGSQSLTRLAPPVLVMLASLLMPSLRVSFAPAPETDRSKRRRLSSPPPPPESGEVAFNVDDAKPKVEMTTPEFMAFIVNNQYQPTGSPPYIPRSLSISTSELSPTSSQTLASPPKHPLAPYDDRVHKESPRPSSPSPPHPLRAPVTPEALREKWEFNITPDTDIPRTDEDDEAISRCLTWYLSILVTGYGLKDGMFSRTYPESAPYSLKLYSLDSRRRQEVVGPFTCRHPVLSP